ncbi:MAG TPA: sigma-70 family RNA polymerase sigma factor [Salinivirga sp.]|uniref:RNA polymerase sigma factor n=1 Tax=Salinivirga sp. TaxID=1970192 RepID=UPI002B489EC3|nr:sigma-70 family RNA polymerase sigma factor [Salinivirga sp.]HKK60028.1 sigma-70 family RNA polymerase sigma factor [Salinivirga sp.]
MATNKEDKFINVFETNIGIILKIAAAYTDIAQDREDLINDIALELWKSFDRFQKKSKISTWLYRVALNTAMNYNRKRERNNIFIQHSSDALNRAKIIEPDNSPHDYDSLYQHINKLNEINKAIILLYLEEKSHREIAEITGISETNVATKIGRIKAQIKNSITPKAH